MTPETSIIIRTLNEEKHVGRLLEGIQQQTYRDWEIVLVDSGSTDKTVEIASRYTRNILHMPKEEFTFGRSLNLGCRHARGEYLVSVSAHVYPLINTWLANLIRQFEDSRIGMVYGAQRAGDANGVSEERDLLRIFGGASRILIDEPSGHNGNSAFRRSLWLEDPFDELLTGLEDIHWAKRIQQKGHRVYYAADAPAAHIHQESFQQVYHRYFREGLAYKQIFPAYRLGQIDALKLFSYSLVADLLYTIRRRKPARKILGIVPDRTAEWLGKYQGNHHHRSLRQVMARRLSQPGTGDPAVMEHPQDAEGGAELGLELKPDEVLIQVAYVGINPTPAESRESSLGPDRGDCASYATTPGEEYSGIVVKRGARVQSLRKGDKVVGEGIIGCGECDSCRQGELARCAHRNRVGLENARGAYLRYLKLPGHHLHRVPDDVLLREAPAIEPLAACVAGLRELEVRSGDSACIYGGGPWGNLLAQLMSHRGLRVTVVDPDERRLALLWKYDINTLTAPESIDSFDHLIDAGDDDSVMSLLIEQAKPSARILRLGIPCPGSAGQTSSDTGRKVHESIDRRPGDWDAAIRLVARGAINLGDHTAVVLPLENSQEASTLEETGGHLKVLINVSKELAPI